MLQKAAKNREARVNISQTCKYHNLKKQLCKLKITYHRYKNKKENRIRRKNIVLNKKYHVN